MEDKAYLIMSIAGLMMTWLCKEPGYPQPQYYLISLRTKWQPFHRWSFQIHFREWEFLAATKQLYKWYFPSVCPSVRLSVCLSVRPSVTPFLLCSHLRIIMKFSGVITSDRSNVHAKGQGQRSKVKVTEVTTQLYRFQTVTPVWIHVW